MDFAGATGAELPSEAEFERFVEHWCTHMEVLIEQIALDLEMINERTTRVVERYGILQRDYAQFGQRLCDLIRGGSERPRRQRRLMRSSRSRSRSR